MAPLVYWGGLLWRCRCIYSCLGSVKMASPRYPVSSIGILFSPVSHHTSILCLQLSSTPCFYTLHDQAPGSTSLLSFVSDVAVFPGPLLLRDCGFDPFHPSEGGSHQAMAKYGLQPGKLALFCCCRFLETVVRRQPAPEEIRKIV